MVEAPTPVERVEAVGAASADVTVSPFAVIDAFDPIRRSPRRGERPRIEHGRRKETTAAAARLNFATRIFDKVPSATADRLVPNAAIFKFPLVTFRRFVPEDQLFDERRHGGLLRPPLSPGVGVERLVGRDGAGEGEGTRVNVRTTRTATTGDGIETNGAH